VLKHYVVDLHHFTDDVSRCYGDALDFMFAGLLMLQRWYYCNMFMYCMKTWNTWSIHLQYPVVMNFSG